MEWHILKHGLHWNMDWIDKTWINKTLIDVKPCFINQCFIDPLQIYAFFYITCVRSVIDYAAPVFHHALPAYLSQELERVQKRAMRIICPGIEYQQALALMSLPTVAEHHHNICTRTFESIMSDPNHKLRKLLPPLYKSNYNLRHARTFTLPRCKTNGFKNSFLWLQAEL